MEETGHYYTVYLTSLAVGFDKDVAYQQATLAQMPDEVGYLDAANLHAKMCYYPSAFSLNEEINLKGVSTLVPNSWRFQIETALHALGNSKLQGLDVATSKHQRSVTEKMLQQNSPVSLNFGLLLHRLGDTFAHSVMGNEKEMYFVDTEPDCYTLDHLGHGRHGHAPDYPFLRHDLFYEYLEVLHRVLKEKLYETKTVMYDNKIMACQTFLYKGTQTTIDIGTLKQIFKSIFDNVDFLMMMMMSTDTAYVNMDVLRGYMIRQIRDVSKNMLGIEMEKYAPEKINKQTLAEFLDDHPKLRAMVNETAIIKAINDMYSQTNSP